MINYNPDFEILALVFLIVIAIYFFAKRKRYNLTDRIYAVFLCIIMISIIFNIISVYTIALKNRCPLAVNMFINMVFIGMQLIAPSLFFIYISATINPDRSALNFFLDKYMFVSIIGIIILISNPVTHLFFYFDSDGIYRFGAWHFGIYINCFFYLLTGIFKLLKNVDKLTTLQRNTCIGMFGVNCSTLIIQLIFNDYLLTDVGMVISMLMIYFTFQNPDIYIDQLMGISNRNAFILSMTELIDSKKDFKVIIIAIDNFKMVNDLFGVQSGDRVLQLFADKVKKISGKELYRFGGDIIGIIIEESESTDTLLSDIRDMFEVPWKIDALDIQLTAGVCLIHSKNHDIGIKEMVSAIDYSIVEVKQMGHNNTYIEDGKLLSSIQRKTTIEHALAEKINNREFDVFYQPIYSNMSSAYNTVEALARLYIPEIGYIDPDEFIRIAEQNGTIVEIGMLVLEQVCKLIKEEKLQEKGIEYIEVNLSVVQCIQDRFATHVIRLLEKYDVPSRMINFEVTETAAAYSEKILVQNMSILNLNGISFSLDDFGTGYSTMTYVSRLPFRIVKIDKEIVQAAYEDPKSRIILKSSIDMLKNLNLKIVAEGIETKMQAEDVCAMGVDFVQGFYFARPMPSLEFIEFLNKKLYLKE